MEMQDIDKGRYLFFYYEKYEVSGGMSEYAFSFDTFTQLKSRLEELVSYSGELILAGSPMVYEIVDTKKHKWVGLNNLELMLYIERFYFAETNKNIVWSESILNKFPVRGMDSVTEDIAGEWFLKGSPAEYITLVSGVPVEQVMRYKKIDEIGKSTSAQMDVFLDDYTKGV